MSTRRAGQTLVFGIAAAVMACGETRSDSPAVPAAGDSLSAVAATVPQWNIRQLTSAPPRFRPGAWSREDVLWGPVGGRLTWLDTRTGAVQTLSHEAWSIHAATGVVAWRNSRGTWLLRDGAEQPVLVAPASADSATGFDGPPAVLWSLDGSRALLGWAGEGGEAFDLLERDGSKRRVATSIAGYYGNNAVVWLDSSRVLFQLVAKSPIGGEAEYRESGWRGALALLDVQTGEYRLVATVPDSIFLRVAGLHTDGVLVTEFGSSGVRGHWLYDPATWQRRPTSLPKGRAFASHGGAVVILLENQSDTTDAVLVAGGKTMEIGRVPRDGEPTFSPSGRRGAIRTADGIVLLEQTQE